MLDSLITVWVEEEYCVIDSKTLLPATSPIDAFKEKFSYLKGDVTLGDRPAFIIAGLINDLILKQKTESQTRSSMQVLRNYIFSMDLPKILREECNMSSRIRFMVA